MPVAEYTSETIERIRGLAKKGYPPGAVAAMLGWDLGRLKSLADRHQIHFFVIKAKSKTPDPTRAGIFWDGKYAWHGRRHVFLPPAEGRLFDAIVKAPDDHQWTKAGIAKCAEVPKKNVSAHISMLRLNLESIGLAVSKRYYELARL